VREPAHGCKRKERQRKGIVKSIIAHCSRDLAQPQPQRARRSKTVAGQPAGRTRERVRSSCPSKSQRVCRFPEDTACAQVADIPGQPGRLTAGKLNTVAADAAPYAAFATAANTAWDALMADEETARRGRRMLGYMHECPVQVRTFLNTYVKNINEHTCTCSI
jgi:hypothetical protein